MMLTIGTVSATTFDFDDNSSNSISLDTSDNIVNEISAGDWSVIKNTIESASSEDVIYLDGKTYQSSGNAISIKTNLTIIGGTSSNPNSMATLECFHTSNMFSINSGVNVVIKNVNFRNGNNNYGGAIKGDSLINLNLENCNFLNSFATNQGGSIWLDSNCNVIIDKSNFTITQSNGYGGLIYIL